MSSSQAIERIRRHNPTITDAQLDGFDEATLNEYADRLEQLKGQRYVSWTRTGRSSVIVAREHARYGHPHDTQDHTPRRAA